jgi:hypothetical protein
MDLIRRAAVAYWRANANAWAALKRVLPRDPDPWVLAGLAQFGAVITLLASGHSDAAMIVAAASLWLLVLQRATER